MEAQTNYGKTAQLTTEMENVALQTVNQAQTARELRTGLSVLIPKRTGCTNAVVGELLGVGIATVVRMQRHIREQLTEPVKAEREMGWTSPPAYEL
ncbi:MAG: hypothetical protein JKP90_00505 [Desulfofustis sp. PB-SRB1]|nr:hypothetical protein [Desulfofustis sp. PB-SRB1]